MNLKLAGIVDLIPAFVPPITQQGAAEGEDILSAGLRPEHPGLFEAFADDGAASGFHDP